MSRYTNAAAMETLEGRRLFAAHIVGDSTVYSTIQAAVDAARPGAVINVDAGVYNELVTVNKALTLHGAFAGVDARSASRGVNETIIQGEDFGGGNRSSAFHVTASHVTIDGFTVRDSLSVSKYGAGIVLAPGTSASHVLNNIILDNVAGLYLANASKTAATVIQHNVFANNNAHGDNSGRGIYTNGGISGGKLNNVVIDSNTFVGNLGDGTTGAPEAAIGLESRKAHSQANITITNNVMKGNGKGLLLYNIDTLTLRDNTIINSISTTSAAIRIEGNVNNAIIRHNLVTSNSGAALWLSDTFGGPNTGITLKYNDFTGNSGKTIIVDKNSYTGTLGTKNNRLKTSNKTHYDNDHGHIWPSLSKLKKALTQLLARMRVLKT